MKSLVSTADGNQSALPTETSVLEASVEIKLAWIRQQNAVHRKESEKEKQQ